MWDEVEDKLMNLDRAFDFTGKTAVILGGSGVLCGTLAQGLGRQGGRRDHRDEAAKQPQRLRPHGGLPRIIPGTRR